MSYLNFALRLRRRFISRRSTCAQAFYKNKYKYFFTITVTRNINNSSAFLYQSNTDLAEFMKPIGVGRVVPPQGAVAQLVRAPNS